MEKLINTFWVMLWFALLVTLIIDREYGFLFVGIGIMIPSKITNDNLVELYKLIQKK